MQRTATAILTSFFNAGEGKRPNGEWLQELKALSSEEKMDLATGVAAITGDTVRTA